MKTQWELVTDERNRHNGQNGHDEQCSSSFLLGVLLAKLEYRGAVEAMKEDYHLVAENSTYLLSLFPEAIVRMHEYGGRSEIEELVMRIGDVPRTLNERQFGELVDGYKVECIFQTPYPGYLPRVCVTQ